MTNKATETLYNDIIAAMTAKATKANKAGNASLANKWATEAKLFSMDYADIMAANGISSAFVDNIAIYAMQKVRGILRTLSTGSDSLDKYTRAIVQNARKLGGTIPNHAALASLCSELEYSGPALAVRLTGKSATTATTQASSSRHALAALNLATYQADSKALIMTEGTAISDAFAKIVPNAKRRK